jgi:hypothetical protein
MMRLVLVVDGSRVWLVGNSDSFFLRHLNKRAPKKLASDDLPTDMTILPHCAAWSI